MFLMYVDESGDIGFPHLVMIFIRFQGSLCKS